jgi:hypothetical protein
MAGGALLVGGLIGFHISSNRYSWAVTSTIASYEFVNTCETFGTLRDLRAGNTNEVISELEERLDEGIISLHAILGEDPAIEHAGNYTNVLRRIEAYRTKFPYQTGDTNVDAAVKTVLADFATNTTH